MPYNLHMATTRDGTKKCPKCGKNKTLASFGKRARAQDGYAAQCKDCHNAYARAWHERHPDYHKKQHEKNRERRNAQALEWKKRNVGKVRASRRKWHKENRKKQLALHREWLKNNPDKLASYKRKYRERHRELINAYARKYNKQPKVRSKRTSDRAVRRAKEKEAFVERVYKSVLWKRDEGICYLCGIECDPDNWHLEHKIPLAHGGKHSYQNTGVACPPCNLSKGSKLVTSKALSLTKGQEG